MFSRRRTTAVLMVAALVLVLAMLLTSSTFAAQEKPKRKVVTITYWAGARQYEVERIDWEVQWFNLVNLFNDPNAPILKVDLQVGTGDVNMQKLLAAVASGDVPDLYQASPDEIRTLVTSKALLPLDDMPGFKEVMDPVTEMARRDCMSGGKTYAVPQDCNVMGMGLNNALARQAGLNPSQPPKFWSEFEKWAAKMTRDTNGDGKTDFWGVYVPMARWWHTVYTIIPYKWMFQGSLSPSYISEDETRSLFNTEPMIKAMKLFKGLFDKGYAPITGPEGGNLFPGGKAGMTFWTGGVNIPVYQMTAPDLDYSFMANVIPDDAKLKQPCAYYGGYNYIVPKGAKNTEITWEFIKFLASYDVVLWHTKLTFWPGLREDVASNPWFDLDPVGSKLKPLMAMMKYSRFPETSPKWVNLREQFHAAYQSIILGKKDIKEALDELTRYADGVLKM